MLRLCVHNLEAVFQLTSGGCNKFHVFLPVPCFFQECALAGSFMLLIMNCNQAHAGVSEVVAEGCCTDVKL